MFHFRNTASLFKLILAISIFVVIFIIIQMSYLPGTDVDTNSLLEERLHHLEADLSKSRNVASELHHAVQRLMTAPADGGPQQQLQKQEQEQEQLEQDLQQEQEQEKERRQPVDAKSFCEFGRQPPLPTDVQMLDLYKQLPFDNPDGGVWKQGWEVTYDRNQWSASNKLKVFVVPHSHNDPGWLKTFEQYYAAQTRNILTGMVTFLERYPRMKFIWAEISYLDLWWREVSPEVKAKVKRFVSRGQLELVTAGWVMHDEANSHYYAILEQLTSGHEWLRVNLNATVRNGWAIDPFGLSPTTAYLLRRAGFDHMVIQRAHYAVKKHLASRRELEFWWRQTWDSGDSTDMFCHLMPFYSYDVPHTCGPDPKVCCQFDFARLPGGKYNCPWRVAPQPITKRNVAERAEKLLDQYRKKAQLYASNVLMVPLGDDFRYDNDREWESQYTNYQKLFDHMNSQTDWHVEAQFGTLSDYFTALEAETRSAGGGGGPLTTLPRLSGDFFTYADKNEEYWSGYYTSRPFHKHMDRALIGQLRGAEILYSLTLGWLGGAPSREASALMSRLMADLVTARRALSLFQHHDGITGTAKDRVVVDYATKLVDALERSGRVIRSCARLLLSPEPAGWRPDGAAEPWLPAERRPSVDRLPRPEPLTLGAGQRRVLLYNSLARPSSETVTVYVDTAHVTVLAPDGRVVDSECAPVFDGATSLVEGLHQLTFIAELAPLSLAVYTVRPARQGENSHHSLVSVTLVHAAAPGGGGGGPYSVQNAPPAAVTLGSPEQLQLELGPDGLLTAVTRPGQAKMPLTMDFVSYGVRRGGGDRSGAYLFLPDGPGRSYRRQAWPYRVLRGRLRSEVTVQLPDLLHTVSTVHAPDADDAAWVSIENRADISRQSNFELAMRLLTGVDNGDRVVTDLNGFQMIERRTFEKLPIQANYYPVPSMAYIEDSRARLTLTLGQPLGGASLASGQLEVMLDRRLMQDDHRGLEQGVTDTRLSHSTFRLLLEHPDPAREAPVKPLPSLLSLAALRSQLHPIHVLLESPDSPAPPPRPAPVSWRAAPAGRPAAACHVELVTLRTALGGGDGGDRFWPGREATLTVRGVAADCRFPGPAAAAGCRRAKFRVGSVVERGFRAQTEQVSLTGVHRGRDVTLNTPLALDPMELYAFRLQFQ